MEYKVFPFIITNYKENSVIQNALNIVIIKDTQMINFFNYIDTNAEYNINTEQLRKLYKDRVDEAIEFMKINRLIDEVHPKNIKYKDITVVSNDEIFINSMRFNTIGLNEKFIFEFLPENNDKFKINYPDNLYIFFLNPFNYKYYVELVNVIRDNNILSRFGFFYNQSIYLSNYYKKEWNNPCPLCFFGNIEATLRGKSKAYNTVSFQTILDIVYKKDPSFKIENVFTNNSILPFVSVLLAQLYIYDNSLINNVQYIDFNNNIVLSDQAIYWEMCDCYE